MKDDNNQTNKWKLTAIAAIVVAVIAVGCALMPRGTSSAAVQEAPAASVSAQAEQSAQQEAASEAETSQSADAVDADAALSLWTDSAPLKQELSAYMAAVTDESSPDFIPVENRIAVFDMDGTLFCETDPIYFDWAMFAHRALDDDTFDSTEEQRDVARRILDAGESGKVPGGLGEEQARLNASLYAGMTMEEFAAYTRSWLEQDAPGYEGMTRGEAFYRPMLELVDYLEDKGFTVYACSGSDRFAVRVLLEGVLEPRQVIGTDVKLVAEGQGDEDGQFYVYSEGERLLRGERLLVKNGKMNKVSALMREIGVKPVLCFGNAAGDESMAAFVTSDNPHRSMACFVLCDDTERERGNLEKAEKIRALCREHGWGTISMGEDWETIYGPGVTKR